VARRIPMVDYLVLDGEVPTLVAHECASCQALYFERRNACAHCGADDFARGGWPDRGRHLLHNCASECTRGRGPFFSVVVALDGGGSVKATLGRSTSIPN